MELPQDWYIDHDGQSLVLDPDKVGAEIWRLRNALERINIVAEGPNTDNDLDTIGEIVEKALHEQQARDK